MRAKKVNFFVSIVSAVVVIVLRPTPIFRCGVDAYPSELLEIDRETDSSYAPSWSIVDVLDKEAENDVVRFEEGLEDLQKIFGIRGHAESKSDGRKKIPPQFMMELYNTIADSSGVTRGKNPYNAKVVRSFIERETLFSHLYLFNISGLEINESVLEAELHLYRKRTSVKVIHPTILTSPYYLIRVYQVLEGKSIAEPDLHKLLNVHYVGAHASGWQVFNVRQAVLAWVSGIPNLGLLVTASNLFDDDVTVEFSRRSEYHSSRQPIVVLFNDDGKGPLKSQKADSHYYTYGKEIGRPSDETDVRTRRSALDLSPSQSASDNSREDLHKEYSYGTQLADANLRNGQPDTFRRDKRINDTAKENEASGEQIGNVEAPSFDSSLSLEDEGASRQEKSRDSIRERREARKIGSGQIGPEKIGSGKIGPEKIGSEKIGSGKIGPEKIGSGKIVAKSRIGTRLSSMDIYERAMYREGRMKKNGKKYGRTQETDDRQVREKRSSTVTENDEEKSKSYASTRRNTTECARHELYVDFKEIGLSSAIIAPKGYSAYHCQGMCNSPLSQDQQPTNHATVQGLVHKMGILDDVHMPCCVPTKLLRTSILFFDDNENVVLKVYEDMVADRCGCR